MAVEDTYRVALAAAADTCQIVAVGNTFVVAVPGNPVVVAVDNMVDLDRVPVVAVNLVGIA